MEIPSPILLLGKLQLSQTIHQYCATWISGTMEYLRASLFTLLAIVAGVSGKRFSHLSVSHTVVHLVLTLRIVLSDAAAVNEVCNRVEDCLDAGTTCQEGQCRCWLEQGAAIAQLWVTLVYNGVIHDKSRVHHSTLLRSHAARIMLVPLSRDMSAEFPEGVHGRLVALDTGTNQYSSSRSTTDYYPVIPQKLSLCS